MDFNPVAEDHVSVEHGIGVDDAIIPQATAISDDCTRMQRGSIADDHPVADVGKRVNRDVLTDDCRWGDPRLWMDPTPSGCDTAVQVGANGKESRHRIVDFNHGQVRPGIRRPRLKWGPTIAADAGEAFRSLTKAVR